MRSAKSVWNGVRLWLPLLCLSLSNAALADDDNNIPVDDDPELIFLTTNDAYVYSGSQDSNYNTGQNRYYLRVGDRYENGKICRAYLKFDISSVDDHINSAKLQMCALSKPNDLGVDLHKANNNSWTQGVITWNNKPGYQSALVDNAYIQYAGGDDARAWHEWDATVEARAAQAGNVLISFVAKASVEGDSTYWCDFGSNESGWRPELVIDHAHCPVVGTVYTEMQPNTAVPGADVRITGGYSNPTSTGADGSYSITLYMEGDCAGKSITVTAEKYIVGVLAFKGSTSGVMLRDTLNNTNNVYVKPAFEIDPGVGFQTDAKTFENPGVQDPNIASAFVYEGGYQVETNGAVIVLSFDPGALSCAAVGPVPPFDDFFDYTIDNEGGTVSVEAYAPGGHYFMLGDIENPTPFFEVMWEAEPWDAPGEITEVKVESCEFATSMGPVHPVPHRIGYLLGGPPPEPPGGMVPTVSEWGVVVMTLLLLTGAKVVWGRRKPGLASVGCDQA